MLGYGTMMDFAKYSVSVVVELKTMLIQGTIAHHNDTLIYCDKP